MLIENSSLEEVNELLLSKFQNYDNAYNYLVEMLELNEEQLLNYKINYNISIDKHTKTKVEFSIGVLNYSKYGTIDNNFNNIFPNCLNPILIKFYKNGTVYINRYYNEFLNKLIKDFEVFNLRKELIINVPVVKKKVVKI